MDLGEFDEMVSHESRIAHGQHLCHATMAPWY
jgi:hypothetical protein